jgi:hypothetical protein
MPEGFPTYFSEPRRVVFDSFIFGRCRNKTIFRALFADNDWNFSGENDMLDDPNISSIAVLSSSMANGTYTFGSDLSQQLPLPVPAHVKQALLPHHLESISSADRNSNRDTALLELLGDFSRDAKACLPQVKAEEVLLAAKSLIRDDLQQFLNTFFGDMADPGTMGRHQRGAAHGLRNQSREIGECLSLPDSSRITYG